MSQVSQAPPPVPPPVPPAIAPQAALGVPLKSASPSANVVPSSGAVPLVPTVSVDTHELVKEILQSLREDDDYETGHDDNDHHDDHVSEHHELEDPTAAAEHFNGDTETHYSDKEHSAIPGSLDAEKLRFQGGFPERLRLDKLEYPFMQNVEQYLPHFWFYAVGLGTVLALITVLSVAYHRRDRNKHFITGKKIMKKKNSELFYSSESPFLYRQF
ncbi:hypothetical protein BJ741DRAFT_605885 [Chytriomyces cf. hyalinus JEL632]|nr:hypothetical protein BJ741DRAFT_605885 [Chytriomyces cf. hyalinus JEL632]